MMREKREVRGATVRERQMEFFSNLGRLVKQVRYYRLLSVEGHLRRRPFASRPRMIAALLLPDG